ncbi:hypothetical protein [Ascidiimonas aurantiaca]|uniref:hypothetical protein n=1 Tax=Ascidiimonas aurantiaca TaxID=1685432 RepID=UPI0030EF0C6C
MIKLFLRLKHWQLFLLLLGVPLLFQFYVMFALLWNLKTDPNPTNESVLNFFEVFPLVMILFTGVFFGWFWSIALGLKEKIPAEIKMKTTRFKIFFFIPLVYIVSLMIYLGNIFSGLQVDDAFEAGSWIVVVIVPLHLFSMFCMFHTMYFVAKTIKTAELQRKAGFGDFVVEFFLLWIYFIGIWIIQPRINKLAAV